MGWHVARECCHNLKGNFSKNLKRHSLLASVFWTNPFCLKPKINVFQTFSRLITTYFSGSWFTMNMLAIIHLFNNWIKFLNNKMSIIITYRLIRSIIVIYYAIIHL